MPDYIELPLIDDSDALTELGIDYMQTSIDGFVARPANVETVLLEANGQIGAEIVAQASLVAPVMFAYLGQNLLGIALRQAAPAVASATLTFEPDALDPIGAGAMLSVPNPDGNSYIFTLDTDALAPPGGGAVNVAITALEPGADANGSRGTSVLIDVIVGVTINVPTAASGGSDEESEDDYLNRLTEAMTILAPRPILPADHAVLARQIDGVGRALALDLLLPGTSDAPGAIRDPLEPKPPPSASQTTVARCTTVAITADDGTAPAPALMQTVWDTLDASREVNFLNYVIAPTYTTIDVKATVMAYPGYTAADVQAQAQQSLADWLDPALFGSNPAAAVPGSEEWASDTSARIYEAVDYLNRADGVHYVVSVQLRVAGAPAYANVDVALAGLAALPLPGLFEITVLTP
jgi:hypothetical protein